MLRSPLSAGLSPNRLTTSLTPVRTEADLMQRDEHVAAHTISWALIIGFPEESEKVFTRAWPRGSEGRNLGHVHVPAGKIPTDHAAMLAQEPHVRPGTPDPYPPPESPP
jgi:hypothetical protein